MLALIANTMESSGFFVLNTFLSDAYEKEDGMEIVGESATPRVLRFEQFFWRYL